MLNDYIITLQGKTGKSIGTLTGFQRLQNEFTEDMLELLNREDHVLSEEEKSTGIYNR